MARSYIRAGPLALGMIRNSTVAAILDKYKPLWALDHGLSLMGWDIETYMPVGAAGPRGFAQAQLQLLKQQHIQSLAGMVRQAEKEQGLSDVERGIVRVLKRDVDYYTKVPPSLLEELQRTTTEATVVWRDARRKSDFPMFRPHLEKIVDLKRKEAEALGYEGHPYNALMDRFEEDITTNDVDRIFSDLIPNLKRILAKIVAERKFPRTHPLESVAYETAAMERVNRKILSLLVMPERTFRMDVSTHPFTNNTSIQDVRITTRYEGKSFRETMFNTIHECGHAIYELQIDPAYEYTPLTKGLSLGVHESQSRFWENIIGRSREFVQLIYPTLKENLPFVAGYNEEAIFRYFNLVRPSLIRVEADEVTYNFHIALRYDIEKKVIGNEIDISELPSLWKEKMTEYLGATPENDAEGVLQDVHWSGGGFGYFPTYTLGNVMAGALVQIIEKDLDIKSAVEKGELNRIRTWLAQRIHRNGATFSPKELLQKILGETYNPIHLSHYLETKYT